MGDMFSIRLILKLYTNRSSDLFKNTLRAISFSKREVPR